MTIRENPQVKAELDNLLNHPQVHEAEMAIAERGVEIAKGLVRKRTGQLAASIHAEFARDAHVGTHARFGFGKEAFWGLWEETGNQHEAPHPFLRPAATILETE